MKKYFYLAFLITFSCNNLSDKNDLEQAYINSQDYSEGIDLELKKWSELDSIFTVEKEKFEKNISQYKPETKVYNESLIEDYSNLSSTFYKNYLMSKLIKLEEFVQDVDFESAADKVGEVFSNIYDEFYELNSKMTKEDRVEIAERIGEFSSTYFKKSFDFLSDEFAKGVEEYLKNIEDFSTQLESTLENLFKEN